MRVGPLWEMRGVMERWILHVHTHTRVGSETDNGVKNFRNDFVIDYFVV